MVTDLFGAILQEIGRSFNVNLQPDVNNSCLLKLLNGLTIQMEIDKQGRYFIIGSDLGAVPTGRYRENLFKEALRANGMPAPRHGNFAYSKQKDHLLLIEMVPLKNINGEKIKAILQPFGEKAINWKSAIEKGEIPLVTSAAQTQNNGMFGLKP